MTVEPRIEWKWGALAALAMTLVALYPQINLWVARGAEWRGSFVLTHGDEVAYSAYINALIDGRPRKNDPFTGRDDLPTKPADESLFSIQFVPAYAIALPAKVLGLSTSTVFIWLIVLGAITSSLAIFWLLTTLSGNSKLSAVGMLFTLCLGTLVGSDCCWQANTFTDMLPFLRRYQPSVVFPLFFVFCVLVWRALTRESGRARLIYSMAAGALFAVLVFSYFYIWTAAAVWFGIVILLWLLFRRSQYRSSAVAIIVVGAFAVAALIPFFFMISRRSSTMDQAQLLVLTHAPDLLNQPEIIGFIVLAVVGYAAWRKLVDIHDPRVLFAISFALVPFVLFNQQILSGRSLQPIHYKVFIANYAVLISIVLVVSILWRTRYVARPIPSQVLVLIAIAVLGWGMVEVTRLARREAPKAWLRDDIRAVAERLSTMAREDGSVQPALAGEAPFPIVFTSTLNMTLEASLAIPSDCPLAVLWSFHAHLVSMSLAESKERFYRHLYYSGINPQEAEARMNKGQFWVQAPLFGVERVIGGLSPDLNPVSATEIVEERRRYEAFYENFGLAHAVDPTLHYVVVPQGDPQPNLDNLDKWYERDQGQKVGVFTVYRVNLRP
jgi:hypothetical protein